nr:flagellar basal body rod C-terminal domain-containing protein [uncultured Desulfobulbus sp.]
MLPAISAATSGLQAYTVKTQATANNVANMNTEGFKRDVVTFSSQAPQGGSANVSKDLSPGALVEETTSNGREMVEQSNTDLVQEMTDLIVEKNGLRANIKTLQTTDEMLGTLINLKA